MTSLLEKIITGIAPHHCLTCGVENNTLCDGCLFSLPTLDYQQCVMCQQGSQLAICSECSIRYGIQAVWIAQRYEGVTKQLVWQYKFERLRDAVKPLASILHSITPRLQGYIVTSVPTIPAHIRQRGYDHAELLAKTYARQTGLPYEVLLERLETSQQKGKNRSERLQQAQTAFHKSPTAKVEGANILLVDDVITTGATVQAAARALLDAKANLVVVAAVAWRDVASLSP